MLYVTGDTHSEYGRFNSKAFPAGKELTKDDVVLILGDFGLWHDMSSERHWLEWLENKPFTVAFIDGNHENFTRLYSDEFPIVDFYGARAHQIRPHIFHICRGEVFTYGGKKCFCFGGAKSHDISDGILDPTVPNFREIRAEMKRQGRNDYRVRGVNWWDEEMPSEKELRHGMQSLASHDFRVDFVFTHTPRSVVMQRVYHADETNALTDYLDKISEMTTYDKWYHGHMHSERMDETTRTIGMYESIRCII